MIELIMICYFVGCAIVLGRRYRSNRREWLLRWTVVSVFPLIGWLFPLFWQKTRTAEAALGKHIEQYIELAESEEAAEQLVVGPMLDSDLEVLSIEEALLVNEHADRRKIMLNVLKQDATKYIDVLHQAVRNEDSETSHYAVSALLEVKRKLELSMQDLGVRFEQDPDNKQLLLTYMNVMRDYIRGGFLDERTKRKYRYTYLTVLNQLLLVAPETEMAYVQKGETEIALGLYSDAEQTSQLYRERFPLSEDAFLLLLQVYYELKSYRRIQELLQSLHHSPLRLSHRGIGVVRFWSGGEQHGA